MARPGLQSDDARARRGLGSRLAVSWPNDNVSRRHSARVHLRYCLAVFATVALVLPDATRAQTIEENALLCAGCHGESGIPQEKTTPIIWGMQLGYLYLQLRDYKSGARKNDQMSPVAATLER